MKKKKPPVLTLLVVLLWIGVLIFDPESARRGASILLSFLKEMVQVLPFVLVLAALLTEWIPAQTVRKHLGKDSRFRGALFAYLLGSLSAGPIYAAFPVCLALKKKGASVRNLTILISTWGVIKVPMLFMELKSLGPRFTAIRFALTLPAIFILGFIVDRFVAPERMAGSINLEEKPELKLPGKNCGACGFATCREMFQAVKGDEAALTRGCVFLRE